MNFTDNILKSFLCPITYQLMINPVVDKEGNTYEKTAILEWLSRNNTSPITRNPLSVDNLSPNRALHDSIEEYMKNNGMSTPVPSTSSVQRNIDTTDIQMKITSNDNNVMISIFPPKGKDRQPADICAVVDISGSMGTEATIKNSSGANESHGLSLLDIVKHALNTIIYTLDPDDRLSLVVYSNSARVEFKLEYMTLEGKQKALSHVAKLHTEGSTNLWDGLYTGMEVLNEAKDSGRNAGLFLLTDGMPNIEPPRGHLPMLKKYKDEHPDFQCTINTFGFGYNLDSPLLNELSIFGNGAYAFIPGSGFVGTVFEHSLANFLTIVATNTILNIEPVNGSSIVENFSAFPNQTTSWGKMINLGSLQYGQKKNIVIEMKNFDTSNIFINTTLKYKDTRINKMNTIVSRNYYTNNDPNVMVHYCRYFFADNVIKAMNYMNCNDQHSANATIKMLSESLKASSVKDHKYIVDLIKDTDGQVTKAFSRKDWYDRWGKHYIPSLVRTHVLEQCNNFKDPGIQHFGGELFKKIRDKADDIFCNLSPPKPSIVQNSYRSSSSATRSAPTSMSQYSQPSGPCFDGNCLVSMYNGSEKKIVDLRKGDEVVTPNGKKAVIKCIVKTNTKNNMEVLVSLDKGLKATKWHPIRINNKWMFPHELGQGVVMKCPAVFSFVLDTEDEHVMVINNIECIALGHNINDPVAQHSYFGTDAVINDLQQMSGWDVGLIELKPGCMVRDNTTGRVCKLVQ